jgi:hypothetical protein
MAGHNEPVVAQYDSSMSRGSRIAIGIVASIGAYALWMTSMTGGVRASPWVFQLLALFFGIVALACMLPQAHRVTLRIVGAVIFSVCVWTAIDAWHSGTGQSGQDIVRSGRLFLIFGGPAAYLMITGRYPVWDRLSVVFNPPPASPTIAPPPPRSPAKVAR